MDTSMPGTRRGAIDAQELARYLRQRVTQLEVDAITAAHLAAENTYGARPDYTAMEAELRRSARLAERAAELRRVLQDYAL